MLNKNQILLEEYKTRINKGFDYIELNIEEQFTLEELASVSNFSKIHFHRIFHGLVGETPFQFIQRIRRKTVCLIEFNATVPKISDNIRCETKYPYSYDLDKEANNYCQNIQCLIN
jgi:AraC family transcriptional regulator